MSCALVVTPASQRPDSLLKREFQRKLDRAWAALLIESACASEALVQHFGGLSKQQIAQVGIDVPEIRAVRDVKYLSSELHVPAIGKVNASPDGDVRLHSIKASQQIPGSISRAGAVRQTEGRTQSVRPAIEYT